MVLDGMSTPELVTLSLKITIVSLVSFYASSYISDFISINLKSNKKKAREILKSVGVDKDIDLDEYESEIALQVVDPNTITITWDSIGGLEDIIDILKIDVISLFKNPEIMATNNYYRPPKGILLYGPPGCGKSMLAQAVAKESNARFINLNISSLTSKWYGESNKLSKAVFTLAQKISPCVIFIDEIDTFLRSRNMGDHEATSMMKAQFLSLWDGFCVDPMNKVIIMGATNRKMHIDEAILSRMPLQFQIKLPNLDQRKKIFKKMTSSMNVDKSVDINYLASVTRNFSGRDIDDCCREASMICLREYLKNKEKNSSKDPQIRKLVSKDFIMAINIKKNDLGTIMNHSLD